MTPERRRQWVVRALLLAAAALLVIALAVPVAVGVVLASLAATRPQDRVQGATPADHGRAYRTVFLKSDDDVRLEAWLLRPEGPGQCAVVLAHGLFRSRREVLERGAWLAERGCHTLALDLRRHGGSGGRRTSLGYFEALDVAAAGRFLLRRYPERPLYLAGVSMGGAAVARAGAMLVPGVRGVVLDSTFRSVPEVVDRYARLLLGLPPFPAGDLTLIGLRLAAGFRPTDMDVERFSARLAERGIPVLVIAGDADQRALPEAQTAVFRANDHPASRMVVVEGATHGRPCLVRPDVCEAALSRFLQLDDPASGEPPGLLYDPAP